MFELRQFNLQFAFVAFGALSKNIQDQTGAIDHPTPETPFQIPLLRGSKLMIENN
jgi:hypothetical protein